MIPNLIPPIPNPNTHIRKRIDLQRTAKGIPYQPGAWRIPVNWQSWCQIVADFDGEGVFPVYCADVGAVVVGCAVDFGDPHGDWREEDEGCCCGEEVDL